MQPATTLRIIYNNDLHEHWDAFPRQISAFRQLSQTGGDVLRLNAGDTNTGPESREWPLAIALLNRLGLHASVPGNHEFDIPLSDYWGGLARWARFPTLATNLSWPLPLPENAPIQARPMIIQGTQGAYGLIGITRPAETSRLPKTVTDLGVQALSFWRTRQAAQQAVDALEAQGVNRIVLISHMGALMDCLLAKLTRGIDVIIGGDSHDALQGMAFKGLDGQTTFMTQAGANGDWVGVADVAFNADGHVTGAQSGLLPASTFAPDAEAARLLDRALGPNPVIVTLTAPYDNRRSRTDNDPLAQSIADGMRQTTGADIAFVRSREVRESLPAGPVTERQLNTVLPYGNSVVVITATGAEIANALKRAARGIAMPLGKPSPLLHPSGLRATLAPWLGQAFDIRVRNRQTGQWEPLRADKTYTVALGRYAVDNPDEFPEFAHPERILADTGLSLRATLLNRLQANGGSAEIPVLPLVPEARLIWLGRSASP